MGMSPPDSPINITVYFRDSLMSSKGGRIRPHQITWEGVCVEFTKGCLVLSPCLVVYSTLEIASSYWHTFKYHFVNDSAGVVIGVRAVAV